jgi:hypothetical protein
MGVSWFNRPPVVNRRIQMHRLQLQMSPSTERSNRLGLEAAGLLQRAGGVRAAAGGTQWAVQAQRPARAQAAHETSSIEDWREQVKELWKQGMTARPIYDRLRQEASFRGSYWAVNGFRSIQRHRSRSLAGGPAARRPDATAAAGLAPGARYHQCLQARRPPLRGCTQAEMPDVLLLLPYSDRALALSHLPGLAGNGAIALLRWCAAPSRGRSDTGTGQHEHA